MEFVGSYYTCTFTLPFTNEEYVIASKARIHKKLTKGESYLGSINFGSDKVSQVIYSVMLISEDSMMHAGLNHDVCVCYVINICVCVCVCVCARARLLKLRLQFLQKYRNTNFVTLYY